MKFKWKYVIAIIFLSLISISLLEIGSWINDHHGALHHGIVTQAICNVGGSGSYVVINYNSISVAYSVEYGGRGITVQDSGWSNRWIWYKLDDVKP